ncbi:MAG: hypothetical protein HZB22_02350 [Deltaproteobacteria bacterium]|nr:hypothetical protein [Deltaproteobacteria bacterium]
MNPITETFDTLWDYCTSNNRLCPMPMKWNGLFGMLKNTKQKPSGGWVPSLPLILAAWHDTMPIEKQLRFKEHIKWASDNNQIEEVGKYLRSFSENEWAHFGEI